MRVQDVMTTEVVSVPPTASVREAAELLVRHGISGLPVVENGRVVGVFSERDLLFKEQGQPEESRWPRWLVEPMAVADQPKLEARTVSTAMTSPALTVYPSSTVATAAKRMLEARVSRLPVVRGDGELVGIVTRADLVRAFVRSDEEIRQEIVGDVIGRGLWLEDADLRVEVQDGEVVVSGAPMNRADEKVVRRLIERVPGVVAVTTQVELV